MGTQNLLMKNLIDTANSDSIDGIVDGSSTAVNFRITATSEIVIRRLVILIEDATNSAETYGGLTALTNGISIGVFNSDDTQILDVLDGDNIKKNVDFQKHGFYTRYSAHAAGNQSVDTRLDLSVPVVLNSGQYFAVTVNDALAGLTIHQFHVEGYYQ